MAGKETAGSLDTETGAVGPTPSEDGKRVRTLTEKGTELYETEFRKFISQIDMIWSVIEDIPQEIEKHSSSVKSLRTLRSNLLTHCDKYEKIYVNFLEFLKHTNTRESLKELDSQRTTFERGKAVIQELEQRISDARMEATETASRRSTSSSTSSFRARKHMEVQAKRAELKFREKEFELMQQKAMLVETEAKLIAENERKKAEIEATYRLLEEERKTAVIEAEVKALEKFESGSRPGSIIPSDIDVPIDRNAYTAQYVSDHSENNVSTDSSAMQNGTESRETLSYPLNPKAAEFTPTRNSSGPENQTVVSDLTKFLLKKDLIFSRFSHFTDRPETFASWKASFKNITQELQVSPFEEMDLLVKFLGPESSKYAASIRVANTAYPERGLKRIWNRLEERYGSPEHVESALKSKLRDFPKLSNKDNKRLYELADILSEIEATKENSKYSTLLSYFDSSSGIIPIINKLPTSLQEKWTSKASSYKTRLDVPYPPFSYLVEFLQEMSRIRNDPGFQFDTSTTSTSGHAQNKKAKNTTILSCKTEVEPNKPPQTKGQTCPIHNTDHHVKDCKSFRFKPLAERKKILRNAGLCFRCCDSSHLARDCKTTVKCDICGKDNHHSALHNSKRRELRDNEETLSCVNTEVQNKCTAICDTKFKGKSCSKTVLVDVYPSGHPSDRKRMYAIVDDQSSRTLARSKFFNMFDVDTDDITYTLSSCSGSVMLSARRATNFTVEPILGGNHMHIYTVLECDEIPNSREEIPTREVVRSHPHLSDLAAELPDVDNNAEILLLIGRDHPDVHHVLSQRTGPKGTPFAQKLSLGWTIIGECCLDKTHMPQVVANKTHILHSGRESTFLPCPDYFKVSKEKDICDPHTENLLSDIFVQTPSDNEPGLSVNDREFLKIMNDECYRDQDGYWTAPLPFRSDRRRLPNNRTQVMKRTLTFLASCKKDPQKMEHAIAFMDKVFSKGHAEIAPELQDGEECWFLPIFGIYHPKKPNQIRMVFDSSATYQGCSLNSVLLSGPDLTNNLLGILLRFRKEKFAVTGDIEQMFHSFKINKDHRNFVRFIWYLNNDPTLTLVEYRMCVHLFGNSPSPAVATYCLRQCVQGNSMGCDSRVSDFVNRNFYVDDGLVSYPTADEALEVLLKTQATLYECGNLRFHKFASNSQFIMDKLPQEDRAKDLVDVNLDFTTAPLQRSLGLQWNLQSDTFTFQFNMKFKDQPLTKRVILSCLNSLYDPLGIISPVILQGRYIFRDVMSISLEWDELVSPNIRDKWNSWSSSLHHLSSVQVSRTFVPQSLKDCNSVEIHSFSDASEKAVCAVVYLRVRTDDDGTHVGFLMGKSKLSPQHGHTIPRLELCAAVLSTELVAFVTKHLDTEIHKVKFYTDSCIVLGYIHNRTKRFHTYVSNRVHRIHQHSAPEQWSYISSELNPADVGSRSILASELSCSKWLKGPDFLTKEDHSPLEKTEYPLINPESDSEIRDNVVISQKTCSEISVIASSMDKFSSLKSLVRAISVFQRTALRRHKLPIPSTVQLRHDVELYLVKLCQNLTFSVEIANLSNGKPIPKDSALRYLDPYLDNGIIRLGGRIRTNDALSGTHGPIIIHSKTYFARLLVLHCHEKIRHQGRHLTEGMVRSSGYWLIGGKRLIASVIHSCVTCRKLRRKLEIQKMGNLPECRIKPSPPFTYVGVDVFGPWEVTTRKTRGGSANSKRWAVLFTCLTSRAVHIELVEDMSSPTFINALRRFVAIRGKVQEFRSDRGTNFVGSTDALGISAVNVESSTVKKFMNDSGSTWIFNPPHSSHMGGVWERMIGIARRILDSILLTESKRNLTHDVLNTLMAEVSAIMNSRPIVPVSTDPSQPTILSPYTLLTQKIELDVAPFSPLDTKDMYKSHWKYVQILADQFWKRWQSQYLQLLQTRRKWIDPTTNLAEGDVVLLKDSGTPRNEWPMAVVQRVFPGQDNHVRKIELRVFKNGNVITYVRPIAEVVLLFTP